MYQLPKLVLKPIFVGFCWIWDRLLKSCQVPREFYDQTGTHPLSTVPIKGLGCWRDQTKNISTVSDHINPQKLSRISFVWIKDDQSNFTMSINGITAHLACTLCADLACIQCLHCWGQSASAISAISAMTFGIPTRAWRHRFTWHVQEDCELCRFVSPEVGKS